MLVRTLDDLAPGKGEIQTPLWSSRRLLHRDDGMGVTLTDAVLEAGLDQVWWYKNHLETVYCLEGEGVLEDLDTGKFYEIKPGTLYALDKHERHRLKVKRRMRDEQPPPSSVHGLFANTASSGHSARRGRSSAAMIVAPMSSTPPASTG